MKEVLTPLSGGKFIFPVTDGTVKLCGGDQDLRTSTLIRDRPDFPVPLRYIDVTRTTDTTLGVLLVKNIEDYRNVDGDRELSDAWTGFRRFTISSERPPDGYTWSRARLTRKQTTSRPDTLWPEMWKHTSDASKRKQKQKWAIEKPKLEKDRRLLGICFIEPDDEEIKRTMKNARG